MGKMKKNNLHNWELQKFCRKILKTHREPSEDEMVFEDDPKAILENENEKGKIIKEATGYTYTESPMADIIIEIKNR
jgi:hypothetical protein